MARPRLAAPVLAACAGDADQAPKPARSYTLDEGHASFRGVALGDAERRVVARFGPDQGEPNGPVGPVGQGPYDAGSPGTFASTPGRPRPDDRTKALRYRGMCKRASDEEGGDAFPYCLGRLDRKRYLYFGGDPIGTVAIAQVPLYGS